MYSKIFSRIGGNALVCYGNKTPLLVEMDPTALRGERSDFDARHKSRNVDKLRDWIEEHLALRWL